MTTYVLIPGAGGDPWYWHLVAAELTRRGHDVVSVDLPAEDEKAGLPEYADAVEAALGEHSDPVLVALSLGGFTAAAVAARRPVAGIVFVNAMIPLPGETAAAWGDATGSAAARRELAVREGRDPDAESDLRTDFFQDVPAELTDYALSHDRDESERIFGDPCAFESWPAVPIRVLAGRDDRMFPAGFQQRVARDRLGVEAELVPGGHLAPLSHAMEVADRIERP
ncbi:alpha/beta fold hydrolase [Catellatospora sichuanensis]|uniref:alpha/beta fold hydrolase n=1 Tax=Catellatospora sichuanensis TaxID=1969805 RepID=UPI0011832578|nr:alpha/beta hydrolase [Catellatospora sichuanensis]